MICFQRAPLGRRILVCYGRTGSCQICVRIMWLKESGRWRSRGVRERRLRRSRYRNIDKSWGAQLVQYSMQQISLLVTVFHKWRRGRTVAHRRTLIAEGGRGSTNAKGYFCGGAARASGGWNSNLGGQIADAWVDGHDSGDELEDSVVVATRSVNRIVRVVWCMTPSGKGWVEPRRYSGLPQRS